MPHFKNVAIVSPGKLNSKWSQFHELSQFTTSKIELPENPVFYFIGSCFALNLRRKLEKIYYREKCYPNFNSITINQDELIDHVHLGENHLNFYNTASILQEFKRFDDGEESYRPIAVEGIFVRDFKKYRIDPKDSEVHPVTWQDPYRREVYASSETRIREISRKISVLTAEGIRSSNVFIITLGLIEVFINRETNRVYNQYPGYLGAGYSTKGIEFYRQKYVDVLTDLFSMINLIKSKNNENTIIFSVSPVPLKKTFSGDDVYQANLLSKSLLRSAVQEVVDPLKKVYYFPSYEIATSIGTDLYESRDGRHVKDSYVSRIIDIFKNSTDLPSASLG